MVVNVVHAEAAHGVERHGQGVGAYVVGRAGFELEGQALVGGVLKAHAGYHLAASLIGRHAFEQCLAAVEHADARGAVHLVA